MPACRRAAPLSVLAAVACGAVCGCASIASHVAPGETGSVEDGVIYYMPSRPFKISVTIDKDGKAGLPAVSAGDTIPDRSRHFVLKYNRNFFGTNHAVIGVNAKGLLQSSNSSTASGADALAKAIGTLAGTVQAVGARDVAGAPTPANCVANQVYTRLVFPRDLHGKIDPLCGFEITGSLVPAGVGNTVKDSARLSDTGADQDGVFYKRDLPYLIVVTDPASKTASQWLAYSPDEAAVSFLPVNRTLLANNSTNITFSDGAVTNVDESTDSDLVALLTFPATVISSYFSAIGGVFAQLGTNAQNQAGALKNEDALRAAQAQVAVCKAIIAANDPASKTSSELAAAIASIKSACGG